MAHPTPNEAMMPKQRAADRQPVLRNPSVRSGRRAKPVPDPGAGRLESFYELGPYDLVRIVETGVAASAVADIADEMDLPRRRLMSMLGLSRSTVERRAKSRGLLSTDDASKLVGLVSIVAQVRSMVSAGAPEANSFDAARWVANWFERPLPALDNRPPAEFVDTAQGQELVRILLRRVEAGVYT